MSLLVVILRAAVGIYHIAVYRSLHTALGVHCLFHSLQILVVNYLRLLQMLHGLKLGVRLVIPVRIILLENRSLPGCKICNTHPVLATLKLFNAKSVVHGHVIHRELQLFIRHKSCLKRSQRRKCPACSRVSLVSDLCDPALFSHVVGGRQLTVLTDLLQGYTACVIIVLTCIVKRVRYILYRDKCLVILLYRRIRDLHVLAVQLCILGIKHQSGDSFIPLDHDTAIHILYVCALHLILEHLQRHHKVKIIAYIRLVLVLFHLTAIYIQCESRFIVIARKLLRHAGNCVLILLVLLQTSRRLLCSVIRQSTYGKDQNYIYKFLQASSLLRLGGFGPIN